MLNSSRIFNQPNRNKKVCPIFGSRHASHFYGYRVGSVIVRCIFGHTIAGDEQFGALSFVILPAPIHRPLKTRRLD